MNNIFPYEIWGSVFSFLDAHDLDTVSQTCVAFSTIVRENRDGLYQRGVNNSRVLVSTDMTVDEPSFKSWKRYKHFRRAFSSFRNISIDKPKQPKINELSTPVKFRHEFKTYSKCNPIVEKFRAEIRYKPDNKLYFYTKRYNYKGLVSVVDLEHGTFTMRSFDKHSNNTNSKIHIMDQTARYSPRVYTINNTQYYLSRQQTHPDQFLLTPQDTGQQPWRQFISVNASADQATRFSVRAECTEIRNLVGCGFYVEIGVYEIRVFDYYTRQFVASHQTLPSTETLYRYTVDPHKHRDYALCHGHLLCLKDYNKIYALDLTTRNSWSLFARIVGNSPSDYRPINWHFSKPIYCEHDDDWFVTLHGTNSPLVWPYTLVINLKFGTHKVYAIRGKRGLQRYNQSVGRQAMPLGRFLVTELFGSDFQKGTWVVDSDNQVRFYSEEWVDDFRLAFKRLGYKPGQVCSLRFLARNKSTLDLAP